ncbi:hypothetical protein [Arenibacter sp. S6351L]|uniref:hypothetical protein n=1 Tax=Arenibacter sp. S6351L TaxID=2926407 RepID=UPI001FF27191|nr:hypothetical protein [Arenibacter sp. S6351L]MCK0132743.1 hypothetical protein [Arenibacter sp. S6351L]
MGSITKIPIGIFPFYEEIKWDIPYTIDQLYILQEISGIKLSTYQVLQAALIEKKCEFGQCINKKTPALWQMFFVNI